MIEIEVQAQILFIMCCNGNILLFLQSDFKLRILL
jgi:hypothetical protein